MQLNKEQAKPKCCLIDIIKLSACVLIVGSHCTPLFENDSFNFYYNQWFFRFCVPFFFIAAGYFFNTMSKSKKLSYIRRVGVLYIGSTVLYLPIIVRSTGQMRSLIFGYHHLWYLCALTLALLIVYCAEIVLKGKRFYLVFLLLGGGNTR